MPQPSGETRHDQLLGVVLHRVALEVNLGSFWKKALATLTATVLEDAAASLIGHAGTESVLLLASALGRLVSHFHGRKKSKIWKKSTLKGRGTRRLATSACLSTNRGIFCKIRSFASKCRFSREP